jgi:protein-S-isoprenylcysteine O-methyltransferase Ste14
MLKWVKALAGMKPMRNLSMTDRRKGHIYVIGQFLIIFLALISSILEPRILNYHVRPILTVIGIIIASVGIGFMIASVRSFKQEITAHPIPKDEYKLMTEGMYKFVRHPIYFSALLLVAGGVLIFQSYLSQIWVVVLFFWFNSKASFEERFLKAKFIEYSEYMKATKKLIPCIY